MDNKKLKVALVAPYSARAVLDPMQLKKEYRDRPEHAAPWVRSLTTSLAKRDEIEFRVFTHSRAVSRVCYGEENGVPYTVIPKYEPSRIGCYHLHLPARAQFRKHIKAYAPDLVHGFGLESAYGLIASEQGFPSVIFIQGIVSEYAPYLSHRSRLQKAIMKSLERYGIRKVTGVIAETEFAKNWARSMRENIQVSIIPHAVNAEFFNVSPEYSSKNILVVGSVDSRKAVDVSIRALALTQDKECRLIVVGIGPLLDEIKRLSVEVGVAERVELCGSLNREQIMERMATARVVTILSRMDTSPNILTEAHAAGLPVIGTRAGGIPDMIDDGKDGYLVEVDDEQAVAEKMDQLVGDPGLCREMGMAGREKVLWLNDPARVADLHIRFYKDILKSNAGESTIDTHVAEANQHNRIV